MTETHNISGACLCGAVQVKADNVTPSVGACHCSQCRAWVSSPMQTVDCGSDVTFEGEEFIGIYDSSDWAERGFCRQCGAALFYRLKQNGQLFMAAGLFGDLDGFVFDHEVFIDEKPAFYAFANQTKQLTGKEVFALFSQTSQE